MIWWYPTLRECPWAMKALELRDKRIQLRRMQGGVYFIFSFQENALADLAEYLAMRYTETGNPAWLNLGNDIFRNHNV